MVMAEVLEKPGPWTYEDLESIPEHLWAQWRFEIVDGGLVMSPSPRMPHETAVIRLAMVLNGLLEPERFATPAGVDMHPTYRIPDLMVIDRATAKRDIVTVEPRDVQLIIEVVSPGSLTTDRITKPAQYAAAGIPAYWRVELDDGLSITAYALPPGGDVYREVGTWREGERLEVVEPFPLALEVSDLLL